MTTWLIHFDIDDTDGNNGEATDWGALTAGDWGEGRYFFVNAETEAGAIEAGREMLEGTRG